MNRLGLSAVVFGLALSAIAGPQDEFRNQMNALSKKYEKAMLKKDLKTFEKLLNASTTKDFKHIENGKSMDRAEMVKMMKSSIAQFQKVTKFKSKFMSVQLTGNKANCTVFNIMEGTMVGPDKKKHTMSFSGNTEEKFEKVGGKWLMKSMEWKTMESRMDGKPVAMPSGGGK
jgi:hypothetical protein